MRVLATAAVASWVLAAALLATADEPSAPPTTPTTLPAKPIKAEQHSTVVGTPPPDLEGRWFAVAHLGLPGGNRRTSPAFWEVTRAAGQPSLAVRLVSLPPTQQAAVDQANAAGKEWSPTPDDLPVIAAGWDNLQPEPVQIARVDTEIIGHDGFDEPLKAEERTKDALWVVRQNFTFAPSGAPMIRQVIIYALLAPEGRGYSGNYDVVMLAAAPFPIPISLRGSVQLYRLPSASRGGLIGRVLDLFKGCGRR
jgi:hypothetical protein